MGIIKNTLNGVAFTLSLSMPLALAGNIISTAANAETSIYYGHSGPARGTIPAALKWFDKRIGELSKNDLKLDIQWGGALYKSTAAVQSLSDGVADMGSVISTYFEKEMAPYRLADLPLSGSDAWVGLRATDKLMRTTPSITEYLAKQNLVYIGTFTASDVNMACKGDAIKSIKDIAGKKIRGVGVYGKVLKEMGATMVNLNVYEAYQGLDTGLIDCSMGYSYVVPALKWFEVTDSYTLLNWGQIGGYGMFMNKASFDALTKEQQAVVVQTGEELPDKFAQIVIGANSKAIKSMRDGKLGEIEVFEFTTADTDELNKVTEPYLADWKKNATSVGLDADALLNTYNTAVSDYTKELKEKGYPWTRK